LAYGRRCIAPGRVELTGLAAAEAEAGKRVGHALAVVEIGARHRRQIFHGDMRRDLAGADSLLHSFGKLFHQSQSARDPAHAAVKAPRQILEAVAEALFQLRKQPTLFQRCLLFGKAHRAIQHQCIGFAHRPNYSFNRVPAELFQSRHALVAVDDQIPGRLLRYRNDHDRHLLSRCRQRRQQPPLPFRIPNAQMFISAVQLVKLQLHFPSSLHAPTLVQAGSGLAPTWGEVCLQALWNPSDKP
jgi:hypothetical protein